MKRYFLGCSLGALIVAWPMWMFSVVSPTTGPYWYFFAAASAIFAILYAGTKEK